MNRCKFVLNPNFLYYRLLWRRPTGRNNKTSPFPEFIPPFREKGHSKWQNIRHQKEANDKEKSHRFNRLILLMKRAISEGGSNNPDLNSALASVIASAKRISMPASTIQSALKGSKDKPPVSTWFELKGPKGSLLYISTVGYQSTLLKQTIRQIVRRRKCPVEFTERMAKAIFDHKGVILVEPPPGTENIEEISLEHAIETGAEEVSPLEDSNILEFLTPASSMHKVRHALEEKKYVVKEADLVYIPRTIVELQDEEAKALNDLCDEIEKLPDVIQVYTNF